MNKEISLIIISTLAFIYLGFTSYLDYKRGVMRDSEKQKAKRKEYIEENGIKLGRND